MPKDKSMNTTSTEIPKKLLSQVYLYVEKITMKMAHKTKPKADNSVIRSLSFKKENPIFKSFYFEESINK